jgi:hypothetical protein
MVTGQIRTAHLAMHSYLEKMYPCGEHAHRLGLEALWVSWEERCTTDVVEFEEQHEDTLKTNTTSTVRRTAHTEGIDVRFHRVRLNTLLLHLLDEECGVVDTLGSGQNLLAAHEEVVGI